MRVLHLRHMCEISYVAALPFGYWSSPAMVRFQRLFPLGNLSFPKTVESTIQTGIDGTGRRRHAISTPVDR